jgi:predicted MFS family arabinose efflux permease
MTNVPRPLAALVAAHGASLSGNVILTVAVPWLVLTTSGSATLAAAAVFVGVGGAAVGGLAAGRVVEVAGPVRAAALSEVANALVVVPLPVLLALDALEIWHVLVLAFLGTLVDSTASTARQTLVPVVADAQAAPRERANGLFTSAEHIGYLLGAPLAGLLIASFGVGLAMWVATGAFLVAAAVVSSLGLVASSRHERAEIVSAGIRGAFGVIWRDPALRALFVFPTVAVMLVAPLVPLVVPVLARETFGDARALGVMVAAYGGGGLIGAAVFGALGERVRRRMLFLSVFCLVPVALAALAFSPWLALTLAILVALGAAVGALVPLMATIRQERAPAHLLARVVGLSTASIPVTGPIGVLVVGVLIDGIGAQQALLWSAVSATAVLAGVAADRGVRTFDRRCAA